MIERADSLKRCKMSFGAVAVKEEGKIHVCQKDFEADP
jgi:hypothetical protein